jgi:hypothetical protein
MKPKIIAWNMRGLNPFKKRLRIRGLLKEWKADIVCLIETKLEVITREVVRNLWGGQHVDWIYKGVVGASGGMLLMWIEGWLRKGRNVWGATHLLVLSRMWRFNLNGCLGGGGGGGCMDRMVMWRGGTFERSWLV